VAGCGVLVNDALLGCTVDLRLKFGKKLGGFVRITGFDKRTNFLFGSTHSSHLGAIESAATNRGTSLFGGGTSISHSPPNWLKVKRMSTRVYKSCESASNESGFTILFAGRLNGIVCGYEFMAKRPKKQKRSTEAARVTQTKAKGFSIPNGNLFLLQVMTIVIAGLWVFWPAMHGDWLWDDEI